MVVRQIKIMPPTREGSNVTLPGGAAHRLVDDAANGLASDVLTAPPAGGQLSNVALFIDQNSQQLDSLAEVKCWGWGCVLRSCGLMVTVLVVGAIHCADIKGPWNSGWGCALLVLGAACVGGRCWGPCYAIPCFGCAGLLKSQQTATMFCPEAHSPDHAELVVFCIGKWGRPWGWCECPPVVCNVV